MAVGADANQKSRTRILKDGTITPIGGLKFTDCLYLARQEELYRGGKPRHGSNPSPSTVPTRTRALTRTLCRQGRHGRGADLRGDRGGQGGGAQADHRVHLGPDRHGAVPGGPSVGARAACACACACP